ncbi:hypothetical protein GF323_02970 [Candidatus Woesearchaeota archaeon]|nr:hypothetical protein [Candidatus Woesearchaeota archaeon]
MKKKIPINKLVRYMETSRSFEEYEKDLSLREVELSDIIIDKALGQPEVNFVDLGCGRGHAALDIFERIEIRILERDLPLKLLDSIRYIGIDKYVKGHCSPQDERVSFYSSTDLQYINGNNFPQSMWE